VKPADGPARQLDIFADSSDVILRNALVEALLRADVEASRSARQALAQELPHDPALASADLLLRCLADEAEGGDTVGPAAQIRTHARALEAQAQPAAEALLRAAAAGWMRERWARLAHRARGVAWRPDDADVHAAPLWLRAEDWNACERAVSGIESWRRIPRPLLWMAQARWRRDGGDAAWPFWAEALWLAPAPAWAAMAGFADRKLQAEAARFEAEFDDAADDTRAAWFPAWALVQQPLRAEVMHGVQPPADLPAAAAFTVVAALLRLERQGRHHDIVAQRARLRALSAHLFAAYMRTR
jgi:hypothetical protein